MDITHARLVYLDTTVLDQIIVTSDASTDLDDIEMDLDDADTVIYDMLIAADKIVVQDKLAEARAQGVKTIELFPSMIFETIAFCIEEIQPAERICLTLPKNETHLGPDRLTVDWSLVDQIAGEFHGPGTPDDVFVVIRHNDNASIVIVADIYRMPK